MPTCEYCNERIEVDDWDNPIEWESHVCEGVERFHEKRAEKRREQHA